MQLEQGELTSRVHCMHNHLTPLRGESGALIGRVGLMQYDSPGALVLHGVRCGKLPGLVGLALARENNQDARRSKASVAGSRTAWSDWAKHVLVGQPNLKEPLNK